METFDKYIYRVLVLAVIILIAGGTIFYHIVEGFSYIDAYYFSIVTLATVGYGDLSPHTSLGKIFTTIYILIGVGIITSFISAVGRKRGQKLKTRREEHQDTPS